MVSGHGVSYIIRRTIENDAQRTHGEVSDVTPDRAINRTRMQTFAFYNRLCLRMNLETSPLKAHTCRGA